MKVETGKVKWSVVRMAFTKKALNLIKKNLETAQLMKLGDLLVGSDDVIS